MAVSHIYNQTVADGTATSVVRPSDWNSAHNQFMTIAGNTAGASTLSGTNIVFQGGNNVTLSANAQTLVFSAANQTVQTQNIVSVNGSTGGISLNVGSSLSASTNGSSITFGLASNITTALQSAGAYLTTARGSTDAIGLNTALTANGVSMTANSSGLSLNFPAFLTTAAQSSASNVSGIIAGTASNGGTATLSGNVSFSNANGISFFTSAGNAVVGTVATNYAASNHSHNFATTTTGGSNIVVGTTNSAGATIGVPPFITTQTVQPVAVSGSNGSFTYSTLSFGNLNGLSFYTSNGSIVGSYTDAGAGAGISAVVITAGGSTNSVSNFSFANSNGVSFGINGSTITASAGGGGGGVTLLQYEPTPPTGTSLSSYGQNSIYMMPFFPPVALSFNQINMLLSLSSATSSISHSVGHTFSYGLYSVGTGASTSIINSMSTSSGYIAASYSSNLSGGYTVNLGGNSTTVSSAGTVFGSVLSGMKEMAAPFVGTLAAGNEYYFGIAQRTASVGGTGALRMSFMVNLPMSNASYGRIFSNGISISNISNKIDGAGFVFSATSAAFPSTIGENARSIASNIRPYIIFEA